MTTQNSRTLTRSKTVDLVTAALMCAVISILSQIAIPMPSGVPVTLQTFAIALCGAVLAAKYSAASVAVYILLGAAGVPVFSGFMAGPARLIGPTGGFIWGFLPFAVLVSISVHSRFAHALEERKKKILLRILLGAAGLLACHVCGVLQYSFVSGNGIIPSFLLVSAPYLIKDAISVALAYLVADRITAALGKIGR